MPQIQLIDRKTVPFKKSIMVANHFWFGRALQEKGYQSAENFLV